MLQRTGSANYGTLYFTAGSGALGFIGFMGCISYTGEAYYTTTNVLYIGSGIQLSLRRFVSRGTYSSAQQGAAVYGRVCARDVSIQNFYYPWTPQIGAVFDFENVNHGGGNGYIARDFNAGSAVPYVLVAKDFYTSSSETTTLPGTTKNSSLQILLTGGAGNSDPNASPGGEMSANQISGTPMNNLFDNVTADEAAAGDVEY